MANYNFLKDEWKNTYEIVSKFENLVFSDSHTACIYACRALESAINWIYKNDVKLYPPFDNKLGSKIHSDDFKDKLPKHIFDEVDYVRAIGNKATHDDDIITKTEALKTARALFDFLRWMAQTYTRNSLTQFEELQFDESVIPKNQDSLPVKDTKKIKKTVLSSTQHPIETLDIVNCAGLRQEVFDEKVYICPAQGGAFNHRQCKYFGVYWEKRVGAVGDIEAVIDVHSENEAEIYWINGNQNSEDYISRAKEKAIKLRANDLPVRIFLLTNINSTDFVKDSKGGMFGNKMYFDVSNLDVTNAEELAAKLNGKIWSEMGI